MRQKTLNRMIRENMKRLAAEMEPPHPVFPPFQLDPLPDGFSMEWEIRQLQKLKDFDLYSETERQFALWTDVIHYRERALVQDQRDKPFLRAYLLQHLHWDHDLSSIYSQKDIAAAWDACEIRQRAYSVFPDGNFDDTWKEAILKRDQALTWRQRLIAKRMYRDFDELNAQYHKALRQLSLIAPQMKQSIKERLKEEESAAWSAYRDHIHSLPVSHLFSVGYEIGKVGLSQGHSGFHYGSAPFLPFGCCGWADYDHPEWTQCLRNDRDERIKNDQGEYVEVPVQTQGVAFRIVKPCFGDRDPLLYYEGERGIRDKDLFTQTILKYSSGIGEIDIQSLGGKHKCDVFFTFRLDKNAIRETVRLSGKDVRTTDVGGHYIFVLPCEGEFNCELGEIIDGKKIPLHHDDFCMK